MNLIKKCKYGLIIFNQLDRWVGKSFAEYGEYSESEVQLFRRVVSNGDVVLDIGANTGSHTLAFSRLVGENGTVIGFEPEVNNFYTLAGNVAINNLRNVFVFQKAIGNQIGKILVPELDFKKTDNFGGLSLVGENKNSKCYEVPIETIDSLELKRLKFIKIDVEGMETDVLKGAEKTIKELRPIVYAENDRAEKSNELISILKSYDYKIFRHFAPLFNPNNFFFENKNHFTKEVDGKQVNIVSINLFCHHKDVVCPINPSDFSMQEL